MKRMIALLCLLPLLTFSARAAAGGPDSSSASVSSATSSEYIGEQLSGSGADRLYSKAPDTVKSRLSRLGLTSPDPSAFSKLTPRGLLSAAFESLSDAAARPLKSLALVLGILLAYALLNTLKTSLGEKPLKTVFDTVCALSIAAALLVPIAACIRSCASVIEEAGNFSAAFLPVFASLAAASGHPASAVVFQGLLLTLSNAIIRIASTTMVPMVGIFLAFCVIGSVSPGVRTDSLARFAKNLVVWGLGLCITIYVAVLALQGMIAGVTDTVAVKAAKFAVSSFVPVVGGALSEAFNTIVGCANLLKTATGAYAIVVFLLIFLPPVLECLLWMLAADLAAAAAEILAADQMTGFLKSIREALSVMTALVITAASALIVSVSVMLLVGMGN